jgi:hypothetical protein
MYLGRAPNSAVRERPYRGRVAASLLSLQLFALQMGFVDRQFFLRANGTILWRVHTRWMIELKHPLLARHQDFHEQLSCRRNAMNTRTSAFGKSGIAGIDLGFELD